MTNRRLLAVLAVVLASSPLWGCSTQGEPVTRVESIGDVRHLVVSGQHQVTLVQGDNASVTLTTDAAYAEQIQITVEGDQLLLGGDKSWRWWDQSPRGEFTVELPKLTSVTSRGNNRIAIAAWQTVAALQIENTGAGEIVATEVTAEALTLISRGTGQVVSQSVNTAELTIELSGTGHVQVAGGETDQLVIVLRGTGDIDTQELPAKESAVRLIGTGDVWLHGANQVQAAIAGTGNIYYHHEPEALLPRVTGSGKIQQAPGSANTQFSKHQGNRP